MTTLPSLAAFSNALAARNCKPTGDGTKLAARCPAHEDNRASLSVTQASDGKLLVHCHAGCAPETICGALGLTVADLFPAKPKRNGGKAGAIVATYDYTDATGKLLFQVCRLDPKDFRQRQPDGKGGWLWKMAGVRRVLYRLGQRPRD